ncbi:MAG: hypothetical protein AAFY36_01240 [Bacteroidota bacterium]
MRQSKLWELYETLPATDCKALRKWVRSPFFNQRDHVIQLFDYLEGCRRKRRTPERQIAFEQLWPDYEFDDHKLRHSMSLLLRSIEQYLIWKQTNKSPVQARLLLTQAYGQMGLDRHFNHHLAVAKKVLEEQAIRGASYHEQQHQYYLASYRFKARRNRMKELPLENLQTSSDLAFLAVQLRQSCLMLSHQTIYNKTYDFGMLPEALAYIERKGYLRYPAISVYYYAYHALTQPDEEAYFFTFKDLFLEHQQQFPPDENRNLTLVAINYCIQRRNQGQAHFNTAGLEIYKAALQSDILLQNGLLSIFTYSNITAMAIVAGELDWATQFVETYSSVLPVDQRERTFAYNLALLRYEQKDFDAALELIRQTDSNDLLQNLSAKTLALKIYYEIGAYELLRSHLDAMRSFLHRKKILAYHRDHFANTVRFTRKLLDLPPYAPEKREQLKDEIASTAAVAQKEWLLGRL